MLKPTKKANHDFMDALEKNLNKKAQYGFGVDETLETESPMDSDVEEIAPPSIEDKKADYKLAEDIIEKIKLELDGSCELFKQCLMSNSKLDLKKINDHITTSTSLIEALSAVYEAECSRLNEPETGI